MVYSKSTFVVGVNNGPEPFLPCGIPDLKFDDFIVDFHGLEPEIDANGDHVVFIELVIGESEQQRRFSYGAVSDHDKLEKEVVLLIFHWIWLVDDAMIGSELALEWISSLNYII